MRSLRFTLMAQKPQDYLYCASAFGYNLWEGNRFMNSIIIADKLHKIYRVGENVVHALKGVSLSIGVGEFVSITGPSGSGKSTMLNVLAGLEPATSGHIFECGHRIDGMSENDLVKFRRENVGFIFQSFNLIQTMTAAENVALPLTFKGEPKALRLEKARRMLEVVGLASHLNHKPMQMSGGQQQRVGIARALVVNPKIIYADEPTGNLDSSNGKEVLAIIKDIVARQRVTVVMVTHDPELAKQTDRIVYLKDGMLM